MKSTEGEEGGNAMKAMLISFAVGLVVGVAYGLLRVKSPAPPLVALVGLLGMVWGEQAAERFFVKAPPSAGVKMPPVGDGASDQSCGADKADPIKQWPGSPPIR
jgi:XapX domain-containing protein